MQLQISMLSKDVRDFECTAVAHLSNLLQAMLQTTSHC